MNGTWDLRPLYGGFDDEAWRMDLADCERRLDALEAMAPGMDAEGVADFLRRLCELRTLRDRLHRYANLRSSLDGRDEEAARQEERIEGLNRRESACHLRLQRRLVDEDDLPCLLEENSLLRIHGFFLQKLVEDGHHRLSPEGEALALELSRSGSSAWEGLWRRIGSTWTTDGPKGPMSLGALRSARKIEDTEAWRRWWIEAMDRAKREIAPVACACLNGIKGEVLTLSTRRGWSSPLAWTLHVQRCSPETLEALWQGVEATRSLFERFQACRKRRVEAFGTAKPRHLSFGEATERVSRAFRRLSPEMAELAQRACTEGWVDWAPRPGKATGAFCRPVYPIGQSRILVNGLDDLPALATLAHELGHAHHNSLLLTQSPLNVKYPMPLAESASLFAETLCLDAERDGCSDLDGRLDLIELCLGNACSSLMKIHGRFLFEDELFRRRAEGPLSPGELDALEAEAMDRALGPLREPEAAAPPSWPFLSHYYRASSNYYNFPYAFGRLLAFAAVARLRDEGDAFRRSWTNCLEVSGRSTVEDALARLDWDCRTSELWDLGRRELSRWLRLYEEGVEASLATVT